MKLDLELTRKILTKIEQEADGSDTFWLKANELGGNYTQIQVDYHLNILEDDSLVNIEAQIPGVTGSIAISRLTAEGHRVLEVMDSTAWDEIKSKVASIGNEGLKQIPSLFIKLVLLSTT